MAVAIVSFGWMRVRTNNRSEPDGLCNLLLATSLVAFVGSLVIGY